MFADLLGGGSAARHVHWPVALDFLGPGGACALFLVLAAPTVWLGMRSLAGPGRVRQGVSIGLRLGVIGLLVLVLAGARWTRRVEDLEVLVLRDASASTDQVHPPTAPTVEGAVDAYLKEAAAPDRKPAGDRVGVIRFAREPAVESLPDTAYRSGLGAIAPPGARDGTDVAAAVRLALSTMSGEAMHRIVLTWDGRQTAGDLAGAAAAARARHVPIDVMPLEYRAEHEVMVERLDAPARKREGEPFSLRVVMRSTNAAPVRGKLSVKDRGRPLDMELAAPGAQAARALTLAPGLNVVNVEIAPSASGVRDFEAVFEAEGDADTVLANNSARGFTVVTGRARVLYVDNVPEGGGEVLASALGHQRETFDTQHALVRDFPQTLAELRGYDAVVLANVPRGAGGLDEAQQRALAAYVHDLGGGLVMIGGPEGFGAGGWIGSDLEKVLPVDCSIPSKRVLPAGLLLIVLDHSGSMSEKVAGVDATKQQIAGESAVLAVKALAEQDRVGVIAFDMQAQWVVPVTTNDRPEQIARAIRAIPQGGGTAIPAGLELACQGVEAVKPEQAAVKHVLLLTDGQSTGAGYEALVARLTRAGATLSTVGVGDDVNPQLLASLARMGKGRYYPVADPKTLPQVFIKEARSIRRTLIQEHPFTPGLRPTDSPLVAGLAAAGVPPLRGMVLTTAKANPAVSVPLVSPEGDPVLAQWQAGLGRVVAFTSDATNVWAPAWVGSGAYERFWGQAVRWASRPPVNTDYEVVTTRRGEGRARVLVLANDRGGQAKDFLSIAGRVIGPDGGERDVRLAQTGPGQYEGEFDVAPAGNYVGLLQYREPGGQAGTLPVGLTVDASAELRETSSDNAAMLRVVNATGGRMLRPWDASAARLFAREGLEPMDVSRPAWDVLLAAAVALFLVDVAARRLAWGRDDLSRAAAAMGAWVRSFTTVRRGDATASLAALRGVKERVVESAKAREPRQSVHAPAPPSRSPPGTARPKPRRVTAATPQQSQSQSQSPTSPTSPTDPGLGEQGPSGLMAAKRRARRRFEVPGDEQPRREP